MGVLDRVGGDAMPEGIEDLKKFYNPFSLAPITMLTIAMLKGSLRETRQSEEKISLDVPYPS